MRPLPAQSADSGSPPRLQVRRPADFLAVVPYLLGFHPAESVVAVLLRHGRVALTARLDLPEQAVAGLVVEQLSGLTRQHGFDEVVLVAYGEERSATRAVLTRLLEGLSSRLRVREALLVSGGRWWSLSCRTGCCPGEGTAFDPVGHPLTAEAVYAGLTAESSRAGVEAQVRGPAAPDTPRLAAAVQRARAQVAALDRPAAAERMAATVRQELGGSGPDEQTSALLAVLGLDLAVRDVAWALMSREAAEAHVRLWSSVVQRSPDDVAAAPLGLLGVAGWIDGNGALLNCCVERLERLDPGYTLGHLLSDISERALPPSLWEELAGELRREVAAVTGTRELSS